MYAGWSVWKCSIALDADDDVKLKKLQTLVRVSLASCGAAFFRLIPDADSEPCLARSCFPASAWHAVHSLQMRCRLHQLTLRCLTWCSMCAQVLHQLAKDTGESITGAAKQRLREAG